MVQATDRTDRLFAKTLLLLGSGSRHLGRQEHLCPHGNGTQWNDCASCLRMQTLKA
jgi:hypothetical protein